MSIPGKVVTRIEHYGERPDQLGDLILPAVPHPAVVCLLHGGLWRLPYARDQMLGVAHDLAARGFAVWNLEYRRIGEPGGGWPGTFEDVASGIDHLVNLAAASVDLDLDRVVVAGHSSGGHLALWAGGGWLSGAPRVKVSAVVGQAPIPDLAGAYRMGVCGSAIADLLGGAPADQPDRCRQASPIERLPLGIPQLIIHGSHDDSIPVSLSRAYVEAARLAGDPADLHEIAGMGHMEYLDPASEAHRILCGWLERVTTR